MSSSSGPSGCGADGVGRRLALAERLLACYQQALGHELPNQLVALQGLARLVEADAGERLDGEGRACLVRLADMARRAHAFVAELADVGRTARKAEVPAEVSLAELCREAAAEVNWLCPGRAVQYDIAQPLPAVVLPPAAARRALLELFLHAARRAPADGPLRIAVGATAAEGAVELRVRDDGPSPGPLGACQADDPFAAPAGQGPFGLFLARLLAEGWGGSLRVEPGPDGGCAVTLVVPAIG